MDIRTLTPAYAVSPQIEAGDISAIVAAGFTTVICNRPDAEVQPYVQAAEIEKEATKAGLTFVVNPVNPGLITEDNIKTQAKAITEATGPVLAYCASGNRSSIVWGMTNAGTLATDEIIETAANAGYNLAGLRAQLDALAQR